MCKIQEKPSFEEIFNYLQMFNHVVVSDGEFASWIPETEFELSFNREGDIYVDGEPLGGNVKQRYQALALK